MKSKVKDWLTPPVISGDLEQARLASVLHSVAWIALAVTLILIPAFLLARVPVLVLLLLLPLIPAEALVLVWLRKGKVHAASLLLVAAIWLATLIPAVFQGGLDSPYLYYSLVVVTLAGLLLGSGYVNLITLLSMVIASFMLITYNSNLLPQLISPPTPVRQWLNLIVSLFLVRTFFLMAMNSLRAALQRAHQNEQRLTEANRALEDTRLELELRVAERTADLEQRARQLQASAEIMSVINSAMYNAADAGSARDLGQLLSEITFLISERFDFYAVNIFLVNETGQQLSLRAANTETARQAIVKGYHLPIDQPSIVASAARTRLPRLADDVRQDDQYLESEQFPFTRSEAALPLVTGGKLLGVLDVQSARSAPLTRDDLSVLQTLANQVAIAIENAELFSANQKTLQSLQRAYGSLSKEAWNNLLRTQPDRGFHAAALGDPSPVNGKWQPEMSQARQAGQIVKADAYTLAVPIKIRDEVTGVVRLRKPQEAGEWRPDEISLVETLSDRLSTALESARLYEETRRRAERERLTGEITAQMRSTNDPQAILQIAARELRKALQADKAQLVVQAAPQAPPYPSEAPTGDPS